MSNAIRCVTGTPCAGPENGDVLPGAPVNALMASPLIECSDGSCDRYVSALSENEMPPLVTPSNLTPSWVLPRLQSGRCTVRSPIWFDPKFVANHGPVPGPGEPGGANGAKFATVPPLSHRFFMPRKKQPASRMTFGVPHWP